MSLKTNETQSESYVDIYLGPGSKPIATLRCYEDGSVQILGGSSGIREISFEEIADAAEIMKDFVKRVEDS